MNTEKWNTLLNDYVDGKLDASNTEIIERELRQNPSLQAEEIALRELKQAVANLPRELAPPEDLWASIELKVKNTSTAQFPSRDRHSFGESIWFRLGAIVAAAGITLGGMHLFLNPTTDRIVDRVLPPTPTMAVLLNRELVDSEKEYQESKALLMTAIDNSRDRMTTETRTLIEENLQVIDEAVEEIRLAIEDDPDNPRLVKMLVAARQKELNFLEEMVRIP